VSRGTLAAAILVLVVLASPAAAHAAELTFTFLEGEGCPDDRASCIRVTGGPGTEGNIVDDAAEVRFQGVHPIELTVENGGEVAHNLTFEPGTPLANYSVDDPIEPGDSVTFNFTTIEDVPPATYGFHCGQPGHGDLGERGTFVIEASPAGASEDEGPPEAVAVPTPGVAGVLAALWVALAIRLGRR
jgi:uncharacterized cupredoxin-like copper-binding protein